jgi:hypothetical protein
MSRQQENVWQDSNMNPVLNATQIRAVPFFMNTAHHVLRVAEHVTKYTELQTGIC